MGKGGGHQHQEGQANEMPVLTVQELKPEPLTASSVPGHGVYQHFCIVLVGMRQYTPLRKYCHDVSVGHAGTPRFILHPEVYFRE